jgi:nitrate reductase NapAB chaperone NapD
LDLSGIVATLSAPRFDEALAALRGLPGVQVHQEHRPSSRVVLTQEGDGAGAQMDGLRRIQAAPGVLHAELVIHYFPSEAGPDAPAPGQQERP